MPNSNQSIHSDQSGFNNTLTRPQPQKKVKTEKVSLSDGNSKTKQGSIRMLLGVVAILQVLIIIALVILLDPQKRFDSYKQTKMLDKVAAQADVDESQTPSIVLVADAEKLRKENEIQAEVYKDAKNGDHVLVYTDKIIIYRSKDDRIVYEGLSPRAILEENQKKLLTKIAEKAKEAGVIATEETPQVSLITEPAKVKEQNAVFYELAAKNDIVAFFPEAGKIILYRPSEEKVLNSAKYQTSIVN